MDQWMGSGQIIKNLINLDLIEIIQFCLNIYDLLDIFDIFLDILLKPPQPLMGLFLVIPGPFEYFSENGCCQKIKSFPNEGAIVWPLISLVLGGQVPRINHGPI